MEKSQPMNAWVKIPRKNQTLDLVEPDAFVQIRSNGHSVCSPTEQKGGPMAPVKREG